MPCSVTAVLIDSIIVRASYRCTSAETISDVRTSAPIVSFRRLKKKGLSAGTPISHLKSTTMILGSEIYFKVFENSCDIVE